MEADTNADAPEKLLARYRRARDARQPWLAVWRDCYDYALPQRISALAETADDGAADPSAQQKLFDGTAPDAVEQLAASLLAQLTPPWSEWFGLAAGPAVPDSLAGDTGGVLAEATALLRSHFERSNFAVELHQCYLDLAVAGTACLLFEEAAPGAPSAFRFAAVPLGDAVLEEGPDGRLDTVYRRQQLTLAQIAHRFTAAGLPDDVRRRGSEQADRRFAVLEAVAPETAGHAYTALLEPDATAASQAVTLRQGRFATSPFIAFRWLKAPGEHYGRSPVMKALPDIRTANKVVELVLKNASIAVAGIWQADDDGVLNPANVELRPGAIIAKSVGSAGLSPLETPGRFDISELMLEDLRGRIRHALLADQLAQIRDRTMTATEVLERSAEMARLLGATFGRLQSELLSPLVRRGLDILARRGIVPAIDIDGETVDLTYKSPLARLRAQSDVADALMWVEQVTAMGAGEAIDRAATARWLARALGVPETLLAATGALAMEPADA
jgi:hypothetical protein